MGEVVSRPGGRGTDSSHRSYRRSLQLQSKARARWSVCLWKLHGWTKVTRQIHRLHPHYSCALQARQEWTETLVAVSRRGVGLYRKARILEGCQGKSISPVVSISLLTLKRTERSYPGTMSKSLTSRSSAAATTRTIFRTPPNPRHSKTSRRSQQSQEVQMVHLIQN